VMGPMEEGDVCMLLLCEGLGCDVCKGIVVFVF